MHTCIDEKYDIGLRASHSVTVWAIG